MTDHTYKHRGGRPRIVEPLEPPETIMAKQDEDTFNYLALKGDDLLEQLQSRLEDRERVHWNLQLVITMLEGRTDLDRGHNTEAAVCQQCDRCELNRAYDMKKSVEYAIQRLRALKKTLT